MTLAIARWLCEDKTSNDALVQSLLLLGNEYPNAGYGGRFIHWLTELNPQPYGSWANGSAMRVSPCAWAADSLEETQKLAEMSAMVTHNHPEGLKGAAATTAAIFLARQQKSKEEIKKYIEETFSYFFDFTIDEIRPTYRFNETCQGTVPQALECFFESEDFEDCLRLAISVGGDSDTLAAIACSVAEAYYGVPWNLKLEVDKYLPLSILEILERFEQKYPCTYL
jgi:ADP-ribosylglycohydrolase